VNLASSLLLNSHWLLLLGFALSFVVSVLAGPATIAALHRLKFGQTVNTDAPGTHKVKSGTPTMGGVLFLYGIAAAVLLAVWVCRKSAASETPVGVDSLLRDLCAVSLVFAAHMALGFADDYLSIKRGKNLGLKARYKLMWQFVVAALFAGYIFLVSAADARIDVSVFGALLHIDKWIYCAGLVIAMMGMSNCTNLTDGLDGLASGLAILALAGLSIIIAPLSFGSAYFGWALAAACLGFLVYNGNPARVFMGDTGSLAIGASLVAMAAIGHAEVPMLLLSIVFLAEGFSVAIQVVSFKTTGKRVFKMAPLHHHFELLGWPETRVVIRFWIVGVLAMVLTLFWIASSTASLP